MRDPRLLDRIVEDFARCGVVGEETNKLVGYLGVVSRHLDAPLAVIVQSSSAAGKSSLMDAVLAFVPEEQRVQYSAMTGQSLFYMGESDLQHKVLAIVEEAGAQRASYALKLLQIGGRVDHRQHRQRPGDGPLAHASVPRQRPGDDLLDHHSDRHRRGTVEPLLGSHGERGAGADPGHPPDTARVADHRGAVARARTATSCCACIATRSGS